MDIVAKTYISHNESLTSLPHSIFLALCQVLGYDSLNQALSLDVGLFLCLNLNRRFWGMTNKPQSWQYICYTFSWTMAARPSIERCISYLDLNIEWFWSICSDVFYRYHGYEEIRNFVETFSCLHPWLIMDTRRILGYKALPRFMELGILSKSKRQKI